MGQVTSSQKNQFGVRLTSPHHFNIKSCSVSYKAEQSAQAKDICHIQKHRLKNISEPSDYWKPVSDTDDPVEYVDFSSIAPSAMLSSGDQDTPSRLSAEMSLSLPLMDASGELQFKACPEGQLIDDLHNAVPDADQIHLSILHTSSLADLEAALERNRVNSNVILTPLLVRASSPEEIEYSWSWRMPSGSLGAETALPRGWMNYCCIVYTKAGSLHIEPLMQFRFYVPNRTGQAGQLINGSDGLRFNNAIGISHSASSKCLSAGTDKRDGNLSLTPPDNRPLISLTERKRLQSDSPEFRVYIQQMEKRLSSYRPLIKRFRSECRAAHDKIQEACNSWKKLLLCLVELSNNQSGIAGLKPLVEGFFSNSGFEILKFLENMSTGLKDDMIEPLNKFYEVDVKSYEHRRKEFEEKDRSFYSWYGKYLSSNSVPVDTYLEKKNQFDKARVEYAQYLEDITSGRRQQRTLSRIAIFTAQRVHDGVSLGRKLQLSENQVQQVLQNFRQREEELRQKSQYHSKVSSRSSVTRSHSSDLSNQSIDPSVEQPFKEGYLYSLNRQNWYGYWVVVLNGKLKLYAHWRQNAEQHGEPISLKYTTVKPCSTDRKYTFEVISPNSRKIFQAASSAEMKSWIESIAAATTSALELSSSRSRSSTIENTPISNSSSAQAANHIQQIFRPKIGKNNLEHSFGNIRRAVSGKRPKDEKSRHLHSSSAVKDTNDAGSGQQSLSNNWRTNSVSHASQRKESKAKTSNGLAKAVIMAHESNVVCADCGSREGVEWVSMNLVVNVCIDCSGAHRSLGSHISKIRSLTLDTTSFNQEVVSILMRLNNAEANKVYEARISELSEESLGMLRRYKQGEHNNNSWDRAKFISMKYSEMRFFPPPNRKSIEELITTEDIYGIVQFLMQGSPTDRVAFDGIECNILEYALRSAVAKAEKKKSESGQQSSGASSMLEFSTPDFAIAELIALNNFDFDKTPFNSSLPASAKDYLARRLKKSASSALYTT